MTDKFSKDIGGDEYAPDVASAVDSVNSLLAKQQERVMLKKYLNGRLAMEKASMFIEGLGAGCLDRIVMGKLGMGADVLEGIYQLAKKEGVQAGVILSGIGALKKAVFRNVRTMPVDFKIEDRDRLYLDLEQPMELISLSGWIATKEDGELEVHAHFSASTVLEDKIVTLGGHLTSGTLASIKVVVVIGLIGGKEIKAGLDSRINQIDVKLPTP